MPPLICGAINAVADLDEQTLVTHAGQIAARDTDVRDIARSHHPSLSGERDCARSQRRLRTAGEA